MLNRYPRLKRALKGLHVRLFPGASVSSHYVAIDPLRTEAEGQRLRGAWQDEGLPLRQRQLVDQQLKQYRSGSPVDVFDVFVRAIRELPAITTGMSLLEIGCSSGYYSEVIGIAGLPVAYSGCDYSEGFIQLARDRHPEIQFSVEDATALAYPDESFDIVVSGCCLLHIPDYPAAIAETARVSRRFAIFHRTPVVWGQAEQWYRKSAYGVETVEIHFNETQFLELLNQRGLEPVATYTLHEQAQDTTRSIGHASRTYVCRKRDNPPSAALR